MNCSLGVKSAVHTCIGSEVIFTAENLPCVSLLDIIVCHGVVSKLFVLLYVDSEQPGNEVTEQMSSSCMNVENSSDDCTKKSSLVCVDEVLQLGIHDIIYCVASR